MGRIRTVKPDLFKHEALFDAELETGLPLRIAFVGLWTQCDSAGRFEWRPRQLKTDVLPYDDVDFSHVLDALATRGLLVKYASNGREYGCIPSWKRHQVVNNREKPSEIPEPPADFDEVIDIAKETDASSTRASRDSDVLSFCKAEREGEWERERKGKGKEDSSSGSEQEAVPERAGARKNDYAFAGKVIRLTQADFDRWKQAYTHLDLAAELLARDAWLEANAPPDQRKKWFVSTSKYLANRNAEQRRRDQSGPSPGKYNPDGSPNYNDPNFGVTWG